MIQKSPHNLFLLQSSFNFAFGFAPPALHIQPTRDVASTGVKHWRLGVDVGASMGWSALSPPFNSFFSGQYVLRFETIESDWVFPEVQISRFRWDCKGCIPAGIVNQNNPVEFFLCLSPRRITQRYPFVSYHPEREALPSLGLRVQGLRSHILCLFFTLTHVSHLSSSSTPRRGIC